ncbi:CotO family spore coat protein [Peribacillus acanthi]|uniref:CotO family spore coat protein n=1 Tax=Peribacillus acanthi TaxID=2171554 RepID=UPI000D3E2832|nr:CotO family spore coat protein [Peribacillus acanthi]
MSRNSDDKKAKPFMYIVQPDIAPPEQNMQDIYRISKHEPEVVEIDDANPENELHNGEKAKVKVVRKIQVDAEENVVVELGTSVATKTEQSVNDEIEVKPSDESVMKGQERKKFSEMTKEELINFLARIPLVVPKPTCDMKIKGKMVRGHIEKRKGDLYYVRTGFGQKPLECKLEDFESIVVLNL